MRRRCGEVCGAGGLAGQGRRGWPAESGGGAVLEAIDGRVERAVDGHGISAGDRAGRVGAEGGLECFLGVGECVQGDVGVAHGVKRQAGAGLGRS